MMKRRRLLGALLLGLFVLGCNGEKPMLSPVSQQAALSGGVDIPAQSRRQFLVEIRATAANFGLAEVRDLDLEKGLSISEHREVYSAHFVKDQRIGLFLSNDISETRFSYMVFKEPFAGSEFGFFSKAINAVIQKYRSVDGKH